MYNSKEYSSNWYRTPVLKTYQGIDPGFIMLAFLLNKDIAENGFDLEDKIKKFLSDPNSRYVSTAQFNGPDSDTGAEKWSVVTRLYDENSTVGVYETYDISRSSAMQVLGTLHDGGIITQEHYRPDITTIVPQRKPIKTIIEFDNKYGNPPYLVQTQIAHLPQSCYFESDPKKPENKIYALNNIRSKAEIYLDQFQDNKKDLIKVLMDQGNLSDLSYLQDVPMAMSYMAIRAGTMGPNIYRMYAFMPFEMIPITKGPSEEDRYFVYDEMRFAMVALDFANMQPVLMQNQAAYERQRSPIMNHLDWLRHGNTSAMGPHNRGSNFN